MNDSVSQVAMSQLVSKEGQNWISCINCVSEYTSEDIKIYLTSCGHMACGKCIKECENVLCPYCKKKNSSFARISKSMTPSMASLFAPCDSIYNTFVEAGEEMTRAFQELRKKREKIVSSMKKSSKFQLHNSKVIIMKLRDKNARLFETEKKYKEMAKCCKVEAQRCKLEAHHWKSEASKYKETCFKINSMFVQLKEQNIKQNEKLIAYQKVFRAKGLHQIHSSMNLVDKQKSQLPKPNPVAVQNPLMSQSSAGSSLNSQVQSAVKTPNYCAQNGNKSQYFNNFVDKKSTPAVQLAGPPQNDGRLRKQRSTNSQMQSCLTSSKENFSKMQYNQFSVKCAQKTDMTPYFSSSNLGSINLENSDSFNVTMDSCDMQKESTY